MKPKILFVAGNISSFDATPIKIYDYLKATSHLLEKPKIIGILDIRSFFNRRKKRDVKNVFSAIGIPVIYTIRIFPISLITVWLVFKQGRFHKLYANNLTAGINALFLQKLAGIKYIFDFHGSIPEERVLIGSWKKESLKYRLMKYLEKGIAYNSKGNVAISNQALSYLNSITKQKPNLVIPCGINFDPQKITLDIRNKIREELNIQDKFVVLYSGSISPWNDYDSMKLAVQSIAKAVPNQYLLLVLSKEKKDVMENFVSQLGLQGKDVIHLALSHTEVHLYTSSADLALLIRKKSIVNEISSPMKFGEYIGAGVPVLISPGIGDATGETEVNQLGFVFDRNRDMEKFSDMINEIQKNRLSYFDRNRAFASNYYVLTSVENKYQILYNV